MKNEPSRNQERLIQSADVLARLPDHPAKQIDQLLPGRWAGSNKVSAAT